MAFSNPPRQWLQTSDCMGTAFGAHPERRSVQGQHPEPARDHSPGLGRGHGGDAVGLTSAGIWGSDTQPLAQRNQSLNS